MKKLSWEETVILDKVAQDNGFDNVEAASCSLSAHSSMCRIFATLYQTEDHYHISYNFADDGIARTAKAETLADFDRVVRGIACAGYDRR